MKSVNNSHFCEPKKLFKARYLVEEFVNLVKTQFFLSFHAILNDVPLLAPN